MVLYYFDRYPIIMKELFQVSILAIWCMTSAESIQRTTEIPGTSSIFPTE